MLCFYEQINRDRSIDRRRRKRPRKCQRFKICPARVKVTTRNHLDRFALFLNGKFTNESTGVIELGFEGLYSGHAVGLDGESPEFHNKGLFFFL